MRILNFVLSFCLVIGLSGQSGYDSDLLPKEFHARKRQELRNKMEANSVAVLFANPERNRSNDVDYQFSQDPNFYYLTGHKEPNAVLLVFKDPVELDGTETNEVIFVQPRNAKEESWTGKRIGSNGVFAHLGIKTAYDNNAFHSLQLDFNRFNKIYHPVLHGDYRDDEDNPGDLFSLIKSFQEKTKLLADKKKTTAFNTIMASLREIKSEEELFHLKKAIDITCDAHLDLMKSLEEGMAEYKAQALVEFGFKFNGAEYVGYPSIVGSGENTCILHYTENRKKFNKNDLLVVDAGAEYHGYTADITRTLPVNGKFTEEQKKIYDLVLKAQEEGINVCKKGNNFRDPHNAAVEVIKKGLMELNIIQNPNDYINYFFHGTSHYLGLDVHDAGTYGKFKPNSVITVEPGIYIAEGSPCDKRWWNIGVRIEDDILITDGDPLVLSQKLPKKTEEIEKVMKEDGILKKN